MNNNQNPYNHPQMQQEQGMMPPQGPMMPPMPPQMQPRQNQQGQDGRRQRKEVTTIGKRLFPKWLSLYPMVAYVAALIVVSVMYLDYSMPWYYMMCEER